VHSDSDGESEDGEDGDVPLEVSGHEAHAESAQSGAGGKNAFSMLMSGSQAAAASKPTQTHRASGEQGAGASTAGSGSGTWSLGMSTAGAAIAECTGVTKAAVWSLYKRLGDLGDVAEELSQKQALLVKPQPLSVRDIVQGLREIAAAKGAGSQTRKLGCISRLLRRCSPKEARYFVRHLLFNVRLGVNVTTGLMALARAVEFNRIVGGPAVRASASGAAAADGASAASPAKRKKKSAADDLASGMLTPEHVEAALSVAAEAAKRCFSECPDLPLVVAALLAGGVAEMQRVCSVHPGTPVKPMLARISSGVEDVLQKFAGRSITCEYKYDGQRAQIHFEMPADLAQSITTTLHSEAGSPSLAATVGTIARAHAHRVRFFSRHLEDTTPRWPDAAIAILESAANNAVCRGAAFPSSFIIDSELVAVTRPAPMGAAHSAEAVDTQNVRLLPFQTLSTRSRVASTVGQGSNDVHVCIFAYDCLFVNGVSIVSQSLRSRRKQLHDTFGIVSGHFAFAQAFDTDVPVLSDTDDSAQQVEVGVLVKEEASEKTASDMTSFLMQSLADCCEGLMVKLLDSKSTETDQTNNDAHSMSFVEQAVQGDATILLCSDDDDAHGAGSGSTERAAGKTEEVPATRSLAAKRLAGKKRGNKASSAPGGESEPQTSGTVPKASSLVATYQPSLRSNAWLKIKKDYVASMCDTVDLVPIGAWQGNGRKVRWYSPILVAVYDPETEEYSSVCRCMSGFTDADYQLLTDFYSQADNQLEEAAARRIYRTGESPDVWFRPLKVWEMKGADFTISPVHLAASGLVHPTKGISLRFPRFMREREDKGPEDATTGEELAALYNAQTRKVHHGDAGNRDEDD
jgi:DNA ligase-1